ncbi:MAG: nucleotidyltransferase substrate binding protein [Bacteroidales bacterium]|nr:nucleotidyltransferase substrate binding protein [Bacteroidales bacterium]
MDKDIRWIQRYSNYHKACGRLLELTDERSLDDLSELEVEGLVQRFEYTFELAWKVLQDLLTLGGFQFMPGPNGVIKTAFEAGYITDHDGWRAMLKSRNVFTHIYDETEILDTVKLIYSDFAPLLKTLDDKLDSLSKKPDYQ